MPFSITIASNAVPSWFAAQTEKTWVAKAANSDQTLLYANQNPPQNGGASFPGASFDICKIYDGGVVDQSRGEYLLAANGGHDNYRGNEVYACRIKSETPYWYRLLDRTPSAQVLAIGSTGSGASSTSNLVSGQGWTPAGYAAMFGDGRMRSQHGWHSNIFANNRVWYPNQSSTTGVGFSTAHAWSFNRNHPGLPQTPSRTPLTWSNDVGPWEWLGTTSGGLRGDTDRGLDFGIAPVAAHDPISGLIWCAAEANETSRWMSLNTSTEAITSYSGAGGSIRATWATVAYDPSGSDLWRYLVLNSRDFPTRLYLLDLKQATPSWSFVTVSNSTPAQSGLGAVYHAPSRSVLCFDASDGNRGGTITKIRVPTSGNAYAGGTWNVSTISPAGGGADPSTGVPTGGGAAQGQYTWSKFNIINDMGDGRAALVVCMDTTLPVYVYKLPAGELF